MKKNRWKDEKRWWFERYFRMSDREIRRANNGGIRKGNYKRGRKSDKSK